MNNPDLPSLRNRLLALCMAAPVFILVAVTVLVLLAFQSPNFQNLLFIILALGLMVAVFAGNLGVRQTMQTLSNLTTDCRQRQELCAELQDQIKRLSLTIEQLDQQRQTLAAQIEQLTVQLAEQKTIAQQTAEALQQQRQQNACLERELTLLEGVITATSSDMAIEDILASICRQLAQAFGADQSAAALLDEGGQTLTVVAEYRAETGVSALGVVIPVEGNPATLYVLKNKVPLALADAQTDILLAPIRELMRQRGVVSLLLLPIIVRGKVVGTIGVDCWTRREFSDQEIELAASASAVAAHSLELAWGRECLQKEAQ